MAKKGNKYQKLVLSILGSRPIMFNPDLARALGSINAGLFLSQFLYWWKKGNKKGMVYKTVKEAEEETCLTKHQQLSAQKKCIELGVLRVMYRGVPQKRHFIVDIDKIIELLIKFGEKKEREINSNCPKSRQLNDESPS